MRNFINFTPRAENTALAPPFWPPGGWKKCIFCKILKKQFLREIHVLVKLLIFMKFSEFYEIYWFSWFRPQKQCQTLTIYTTFHPWAKIMIFLFFHKNMKKILKTKNFQNWKRENHRKSDIYKVVTSVGPGKSAFSVFYEKAENSLKFTKFI